MNKNSKRPHSALSKPRRRRRVPACLELDWSDGVLRFQGEENGPTAEQRRTDNPAGYLVEVPRGSKKEIMWLQKLGAGVIEHFQPSLKEKIRQPIYIHKLPHGYRLFQTMGKGTRTDIYLYGHPMGPRKRFRSPREFEKHLIWLASDMTRNPANCGCDKCKGDGYRQPPEMPMQSTPHALPNSATEATASSASQYSTGDHESTPGPGTRNVTPKVTEPPPPSAAPTPVSAPPPQPQSQSQLQLQTQPQPQLQPQLQSQLQSQPQARPQAQPQLQKPPTLEAALMSSRTHSERDSDLTPIGLSIYRRGEQVWFQTGEHWALGVVVDTPSAIRKVPGYQLAPLTSPLRCESTTLMTGRLRPQQLRPWVAWTTPPVSNPALNREDVDYINLPWRQESANPTVEVDASIIKSRDVDASWTLIDQLTPQGDYAGVYHGAEKFWVGDAVRLRIGVHPAVTTGNELFIVSAIRDTQPNTPRGIRVKETGVILSGDLYRMTPTKQKIPPPPVLPAAVIQDLQLRSARTAPEDPTTPFWTYIGLATSVNVKLDDVKGRWYPSEPLYIIINGEAALNVPGGVIQRIWDDTGSKMNEMGTGGQVARLGRRRFDLRHQAFAHAIKSDIVFETIEPPHAVPQQQNFPVMMGSVPPTGGIPAGTTHDGHGGAPGGGGSGGGEIVDLTAPDDQHDVMEYLEEDDFMRKMGEDAASFLADETDGFYGGL